MTTTPPPVEPAAGPVPPDNQPGHHPDVEQDRPTGPPPIPESVVDRFEFAFEPAFRLAALPFGVTPRTAWVELRGDRLDVRFGPWRARVDLDEIEGTAITGPYQRIKVMGPAHLSFADRGVTFATNHHRGVCIRLRHPVAAIDPFGLIRHPGITVTVADPEGLVERIAERS